VDEPLAQGRDRAGPDDGRVPLEVDLDEVGERELGDGFGAVQARLDHVTVVLHGGALGWEGAAGLAVAVGVVVPQLPLPGRKLPSVAALDRGHLGFLLGCRRVARRGW
jgi:hypothetical protein